MDHYRMAVLSSRSWHGSSAGEHPYLSMDRHLGVSPAPELVTALLKQIADSLAVYSSAMEDARTIVISDSTGNALRLWLQSYARQTEAAMHRLRELGLAKTAAATELSQSLTVLVLVADMIAAGHFPNPAEAYELLRRNAYRAAGYLYELREQLAPQMQP